MLTPDEAEAIIELTEAFAERAVGRKFNEEEDYVKVPEILLGTKDWPNYLGSFGSRTEIAKLVLRKLANVSK